MAGSLNRPPPWSDHEFLDNFCAGFVTFVISRLNCKIRVPRLQCFLPVNNHGKMHPNLSFWGHKMTFSRKVPSPLHIPLPSTPTASPLFTEILNTPLDSSPCFSVVVKSRFNVKGAIKYSRSTIFGAMAFQAAGVVFSSQLLEMLAISSSSIKNHLSICYTF